MYFLFVDSFLKSSQINIEINGFPIHQVLLCAGRSSQTQMDQVHPGGVSVICLSLVGAYCCNSVHLGPQC